MSFNAFMPGADNWMRGQPMPGQPAQMGQPVPQSPAPAQPERKRPILNAFSKIFEIGAPEAFQQGRDKRLTRDLGNALAEGNYGGAAEMALRGGQLETGLKLRGEAETRQQTQMAEQRKAEAQGTFQLFSTMQAPQINQYAMEDPVGFERATGMTSEEYLQAAQQFQQYGMTPDKFREYVLQKAQAELGMESKPTEYGLDLVPVLDPATGQTIYVQSSKAGGYRRVDGIVPLPEEPQGPMSTMGKLAADLQAGLITPEQYQMEIGRMQRSDPSFSVEFGEGGSLAGITYGSAPRGQEAAVVRGADGQALVTPTPQQEAYNKAVRGFEEFKAQNSIVVQDIDRALGAISGWSTGAGAALKDLPIVGGITPAGQLESLMSTIQANVGFDKLQAMREASPTGGALGSVTEKELAFLQSVFGSLRQDTSAENVRFNLTRLKQHMQGREARIQAAMAADFPTLAETAQFRGQTNAQIQALSADEAAELERLEALERAGGGQ